MAEGITRVRGTQIAIILLVLAMSSIAAALFILYRVNQVAQWDRDYITLAVDSSAVAENIARLADDITRGLAPDTRNMEGLRLTFEDNLFALREGDEFIELPPAPVALQDNIDALEAEFQPMSDAIDQILDRRAAYVLIQQEADIIATTVPEVTAPLEISISELANRRAPAEQLTLLTGLVIGANNLVEQANAVTRQGYDADALAAELDSSVAALSGALQQLINGQDLGFRPATTPTVDAALSDALVGMQRIQGSVATIIEEAGELAMVQAAAAEISRLRNNVKFTAENNLQQSFIEYRDGRTLDSIHGYVLGGVTVVLLVIFVTVLYAMLYRAFCNETVLMYDGEEFVIRDISFLGLCFVSLQSLIAINTGWDFGDDDHRFRFLNTSETLIGFIILTFFVGAYTRMILA